jgi:ATP-binding cassette subfamily F protein 3
MTKGTPVTAEPASSPAKPSSKKAVKVKVRTVEDVERDIEKAEALVKAVEEALSQAALNADAVQLTQLSADYERAKAQVDELLEEWERLADTAG